MRGALASCRKVACLLTERWSPQFICVNVDHLVTDSHRVQIRGPCQQSPGTLTWAIARVGRYAHETLVAGHEVGVGITVYGHLVTDTRIRDQTNPVLAIKVMRVLASACSRACRSVRSQC